MTLSFYPPPLKTSSLIELSLADTTLPVFYQYLCIPEHASKFLVCSFHLLSWHVGNTAQQISHNCSVAPACCRMLPSSVVCSAWPYLLSIKIATCRQIVIYNAMALDPPSLTSLKRYNFQSSLDKPPNDYDIACKLVHHIRELQIVYNVQIQP